MPSLPHNTRTVFYWMQQAHAATASDDTNKKSEINLERGRRECPVEDVLSKFLPNDFQKATVVIQSK